MSIFPFTQHGVNQALDALYQLSEEILQKEAIFIQQDFIKWLSEHFELSRNHVSYLYKLPDNLVRSVSQQICVAIVNRLPIILDLNRIIDKQHQSCDKIRIISVTETIYSPVSGIQKSGSLTLSVNY